jgi:diguanylate cyclase (GGDEF)-like protein
MRLIERNDAPLVAALLVGTVVMFGQPLRSLLKIAEDLSTLYQIDLLPGLFVFVLVLAVRHRTQHREAIAALQLATRDTEDARRYATSLGQLVAASRALTNAVDIRSLRHAALRELPPLLAQRPFWLALAGPERWDWIIEPAEEVPETLVDVSRRLLDGHDNPTPIEHEQWQLFPLRVAGGPEGMLGVRASEPLAVTDISRFDALAAVLSVSLKNVQLFDALKTSSVSDTLTGCFNQAHAFTTLEAELRRANRSRSPVSVVMLDVDGFKRVNDEHGHVYGDRLLAAIGDTLHRTLRTSDVKCRYGGDEFLAILPDTPPAAAEHVAEHLRRAIDGMELASPAGSIACYISVGVATAAPDELDAVAVVHRADESLYRDKARAVRPRVRECISPQHSTVVSAD